MEKIINGTIYNTEDAEEIFHWSNGEPKTDFRHCQETLFQFDNGDFAILGEGGPMTRYAQSVPGGGRSAGKELRIVSKSEAKDWLEMREANIRAFKEAGFELDRA